MKLLKGLLAIAIISLIAVSCKGEKKDVDTATKDNIEVVTNTHKCDDNCHKNGCTEAKKSEHKCNENCKEGNCPHHTKKTAHKCTDAKCSADCTDKDCSKCAEKQAACKAKCAIKKSA